MNRSDLAGADVYRVTGPPENFITAMTIGWWAVNERNVGVWKRLNPGDLLLFHSTIKSGYSSGLDAAVVGYARVGQQKRQKKPSGGYRKSRNTRITGHTPLISKAFK